MRNEILLIRNENLNYKFKLAKSKNLTPHAITSLWGLSPSTRRQQKCKVVPSLWKEPGHLAHSDTRLAIQPRAWPGRPLKELIQSDTARPQEVQAQAIESSTTCENKKLEGAKWTSKRDQLNKRQYHPPHSECYAAKKRMRAASLPAIWCDLDTLLSEKGKVGEKWVERK